MKVVISLSGGADSSTALGYAVEKYGRENIYAISFSYGTKHSIELRYARKIVNYYKIKDYQIIKINPNLFQGSTSTLLKGGGEIEKNKTYAEIIEKNGRGAVSTYIPGRNFLFSAYINARAESIYQATKEDVIIMLGIHSDDAAGNAYPDTSVEFSHAMELATRISSCDHVHYQTPFVNMTKKEVIKLGLSLTKPVPYEKTISCYDPVKNEKGKWVSCGKCATCLDRKKAIDEAIKELREKNNESRINSKN